MDANDKIQQLEKFNQMLLTILDSIQNGVYAIDENEKIIIYNRVVEKSENCSRDSMLGKNEKEAYFLQNGMIYNDEYTKKIRASKKTLHNELVNYMSKDGKKHTVIQDIYPFYYQGKYAGAYTIGHDIKTLNDVYTFFKDIQAKSLEANDNASHQQSTHYKLDDIIGKSEKIKDTIRIAKRVAKYDSPVMLIGETGTGKEMFAQGIHYASKKSNAPFVPINCSAIPESLLESILFGTTIGSFTGATNMPGLFEQAENGTIFLDEINSMPVTCQAKLLRVIQDKKVRRIGSKKEIPVNCRIISASNEDPFKNQDLFRNDLFFRLAVINIKIPPLRERQEDILCLTNHFINIFNQRFSVSIEKIDEELQRILYIYNWPGNVRELKNILESTMIFVEENETILKFEHIPEYFREKMLNEKTIIKKNVTAQITLQEALDRLEKEMILQALEDNQWNISRSARQLGILRQNLQQKIKRHKIIRE